MADADGGERDAVFAAHGVAVAYLFGSRAEGREHPASDHDVAVLFDVEPGWDTTIRPADALAPALATPVDVDAFASRIASLVA